MKPYLYITALAVYLLVTGAPVAAMPCEERMTGVLMFEQKELREFLAKLNEGLGAFSRGQTKRLAIQIEFANESQARTIANKLADTLDKLPQEYGVVDFATLERKDAGRDFGPVAGFALRGKTVTAFFGNLTHWWVSDPTGGALVNWGPGPAQNPLQFCLDFQAEGTHRGPLIFETRTSSPLYGGFHFKN